MIRDVAAKRLRDTAGLGDISRGFSRAFGIDVKHRHAAARFPEAPAGGPADTAAATGDDDRFVLKAAHVSPWFGSNKI
jgi:hypothetical protein